MTYVYDFGDWWEHRIAAEKINELEHPDVARAIVCTGGRGDAPIEDWQPDGGRGTTPFDVDEVNRTLAKRTGVLAARR
jgi:hypothetical protein